MYIIQEQYKRFESFVRSLPQVFEREGTTIYKQRNEIKVFRVDGVQLNVKRYRSPSFPNNYVYSFLRLPKVVRAYRYALRLAGIGVPTPEPVAYILEKRGCRVGLSYLVTFQSPLTRDFYEFGQGPLAGREDIVRAFARFTASLHDKGVLHKDYSPGNILFDTDGEGNIVFSIVDINRMKFAPVSVKQGCRAFARLWGKRELFELLAEEYAAARHADAGRCREWVLAGREEFWKRRNHDFYEYE